MGGKSKDNNGGARKQSATWSDVAIRLIDAFYDLAQTGNLLGLIVVGILLWCLIIAVRIPEDTIGDALAEFWSFLSSEKYYLTPLLFALIASIVTNIVQAKVYKAHIRDLTEHRKFLVHGLETGKLNKLKKHTTSGFDVVSDAMTKSKGETDDSASI